MLNLTLRDEFLGSHMTGTAITLRRNDNTGAAQQSPEQILSITYPTADVQTALRALSTQRAQRPIVLMGERGRGKSHIMAVMHHAVESPDRVETWAQEWGKRPGADPVNRLALERGFTAISEPMQNQEYPLLWELLFDRHPKGQLYRGRFQQMDRPYPPRSLLEEMFEAQPVALILDELQRWFDGLHDDPGPTGRKWRESASNFIQNLSEISKDRPDILILVISVLNNNTEAFRQVHRDGPVLVDFRGPTAKQDREKLVLHRLFKNRDNIPNDEVRNLVSAYAGERFRLRFSHLSEAERSRIVSEVVDCWPFSPELLELLEGHILMAEAAQETRDLIRILAQAYRVRGEKVPLITPADFFVDEDSCGVQSLLDSIATVGEQEKLREVARRNLEAIWAVGAPIPHARELVSALWMRSMSPGKNPGTTRQELHLDITRDRPQDDNSFQGELALLIENSSNIHGEESPDGRLRFGPEANPRSKVRTTAKNDKLWHPGATTAAVSGQNVHPGKDFEHIRTTLRHILVPEAIEPASRVIVLGPGWRDDPWADVEEATMPSYWDRPTLIAIPVPLDRSEDDRIPDLGRWLAGHVPRRRNTVRFLLPMAGSRGIYEGKEFSFCARCSYLTSLAWRDDPKYRGLKEGVDKPLRDILKKRYDRFAVLRRWDFPNPEQCVFEVERVDAQGGEIPTAVEQKLRSDLFDPAAFQNVVLEYARNSWLVGKLLEELAEPPPRSATDAIPYLGDTALYEEVLKVAAGGKVVLNVGGAWVRRLSEQADDEEALRFIRSKAFRSGEERRQVQLGLPGAVGGTTVTAPGPPVPVVTPPGSRFVPSSTDEKPLIGEGTGSDATRGEEPKDESLPPVPQSIQARQTEEPQTGINLAGCFEKWGIPSGTELASAKIEFREISVQQMKQILQRLPSSFRAWLEVSYSEEDES